MLVDLLKVLKVFGAGQLVLRHLLFRVLIVFIKKFQELPVEDDLRPDLVDCFRPLEELFQSIATVIESRFVVKVGFYILFLERLYLLREDTGRAIHDLLHGVFVLSKLLCGGLLQLGQIIVKGVDLLDLHLQIQGDLYRLVLALLVQLVNRLVLGVELCLLVVNILEGVHLLNVCV